MSLRDFQNESFFTGQTVPESVVRHGVVQLHSSIAGGAESSVFGNRSNDKFRLHLLDRKRKFEPSNHVSKHGFSNASERAHRYFMFYHNGTYQGCGGSAASSGGRGRQLFQDTASTEVSSCH